MAMNKRNKLRNQDRGVKHVIYGALQKVPSGSSLRDVKGQDHIITTLQNQIKANRIGHAYLFCGTRGTGKTTVAKIFAKAVNCEHPVDGSPCGECADVQVNRGRYVDECD